MKNSIKKKPKNFLLNNINFKTRSKKKKSK